MKSEKLREIIKITKIQLFALYYILYEISYSMLYKTTYQILYVSFTILELWYLFYFQFFMTQHNGDTKIEQELFFTILKYLSL